MWNKRVRVLKRNRGNVICHAILLVTPKRYCSIDGTKNDASFAMGGVQLPQILGILPRRISSNASPTARLDHDHGQNVSLERFESNRTFRNESDRVFMMQVRHRVSRVLVVCSVGGPVPSIAVHGDPMSSCAGGPRSNRVGTNWNPTVTPPYIVLVDVCRIDCTARLESTANPYHGTPERAIRDVQGRNDLWIWNHGTNGT